MSSAKEKYDAALVVFNEKKRELFEMMKESGTELLSEGLLPYIQHPIIGIEWRQYTPYFNDGEPCIFGVNEPEFYLDGIDESLYAWVGNRDSKLYGDDQLKKAALENPLIVDNIKAINAFFNSQPDDLFETVFGDHMKIKAMVVDGALKFETEEYDHD